MLKNVRFRFQKKVHKGFADPVKTGQPDPGHHHRVHYGMFDAFILLHFAIPNTS
jgi:hypothetical protein